MQLSDVHNYAALTQHLINTMNFIDSEGHTQDFVLGTLLQLPEHYTVPVLW